MTVRTGVCGVVVDLLERLDPVHAQDDGWHDDDRSEDREHDAERCHDAELTQALELLSAEECPDETMDIVIAPTHCKKQLEKLKVKKIIELNAGKDTEINGVEIKAVVSYNINKFNDVGELCHTKKYGGVGYIITIDKIKIYNLGDTDNINEFDNIEKNIDIALVPVSGTYVMTANEAAEAVNRIRPKIAIPMHYNSIVGSVNDAREFKNLARCNVKILRPYE